jgi:methionine sulfoxide reductase catalytic subunit
MSRPWNLPERDATPQSVFLSRRRLLKGLGLSAAGAVGAGLWWWWRDGSDEEVLAAGRVNVPGKERYPARRNPKFGEVDRPLTEEAAAARYCNFYEFSGGKQVWRYVESFEPVPWKVEVTGLVARPRTFDLDDLVQAFPLEERIYRHRCVEAWTMAVPWTGFPMIELMKHVEPRGSAHYVRFVSFNRPEEASRQRSRSMPWPYTEGLTIQEAANELTFLAMGMYGHPLLKQHGAPVRLVVPWKYGFKSAKSIVRIEFTAEQPATFWNTLVPHEYDFWANVNPEVPHPRWSQRSERMLGTGEGRPTQLYNGYGEWVAHLYPAGFDSSR